MKLKSLEQLIFVVTLYSKHPVEKNCYFKVRKNMYNIIYFTIIMKIWHMTTYRMFWIFKYIVYQGVFQ